VFPAITHRRKHADIFTGCTSTIVMIQLSECREQRGNTVKRICHTFKGWLPVMAENSIEPLQHKNICQLQTLRQNVRPWSNAGKRLNRRRHLKSSTREYCWQAHRSRGKQRCGRMADHHHLRALQLKKSGPGLNAPVQA